PARERRRERSAMKKACDRERMRASSPWRISVSLPPPAQEAAVRAPAQVSAQPVAERQVPASARALFSRVPTKCLPSACRGRHSRWPSSVAQFPAIPRAAPLVPAERFSESALSARPANFAAATARERGRSSPFFSFAASRPQACLPASCRDHRSAWPYFFWLRVLGLCHLRATRRRFHSM